jgi:hypothetical protein
MPLLRSYLSSGKQMKHLHLSVVRHALRNMSNSKVATGWVVKALEDLKAQGVTEIKNIPWNGVN